MTSVVRIRRKGGEIVQDCDVYIGRKCNMGGWNLPDSKWANPYKVSPTMTMEEVLEVLDKYEIYVRNRPDLMASLEDLRGKRLGCWCKDRNYDPCHGDVLVKLINEYYLRDTSIS